MKKNNHFSILVGLLAVIASACSMSKDSADSGSTNERGGSLARFAVVGDFLYTVSASQLTTFNLQNPQVPSKVNSSALSFYTETIFPYGNALLLGTDNGMFVYDITTPQNPTQKTFFQHIKSCDPVVAQANYAYLTLNTASQRCSNGYNQLQIVDIGNLLSPRWVKSIDLYNPRGLDIANDTLYVCDNGLRIFDMTDKSNPQELKYYQNYSTTFNDVICHQGLIMVIADNGLHQFRIVNGDLTEISNLLALNN